MLDQIGRLLWLAMSLQEVGAANISISTVPMRRTTSGSPFTAPMRMATSTCSPARQQRLGAALDDDEAERLALMNAPRTHPINTKR